METDDKKNKKTRYIVLGVCGVLLICAITVTVLMFSLGIFGASVARNQAEIAEEKYEAEQVRFMIENYIHQYGESPESLYDLDIALVESKLDYLQIYDLTYEKIGASSYSLTAELSSGEEYKVNDY